MGIEFKELAAPFVIEQDGGLGSLHSTLRSFYKYAATVIFVCGNVMVSAVETTKLYDVGRCCIFVTRAKNHFGPLVAAWNFGRSRCSFHKV